MLIENVRKKNRNAPHKREAILTKCVVPDDMKSTGSYVFVRCSTDIMRFSCFTCSYEQTQHGTS